MKSAHAGRRLIRFPFVLGLSLAACSASSAGFDRPVRFDVYASTRRVYVFADGQPYGCAVLPSGRMPAGPITVAYGAVLLHGGIDEGVTGDMSAAPHAYLRRFSLMHSDRRFDDLGINLTEAAPAWDEARLPCATHWYGGSTE